MSYVQFTGRKTHSWGYDNNIVTEHDVEIHNTSFAFTRQFFSFFFFFSCAMHVSFQEGKEFPGRRLSQDLLYQDGKGLSYGSHAKPNSHMNLAS